MTIQPISILGAGSWGTALALYLGRRGQPVRIWSIETSEIKAMRMEKVNNRYLPGYSLPDTITPCIELEDTIQGVQDILVVVPSVGFRQTLSALKPLITQPIRIICATKGLDEESGALLEEVMTDVFGDQVPFAVLSGPSFAREVAAGLPTAVVIASKTREFVVDLTARFQSDIFCIDQSEDVIGVEVGGVVKNVIAIATGVSDGLGFGVNARSAIVTRGLHEITALGLALGGQLATFTGLSGLGDLILTCSDDQSRNRRFGLALGQQKSVAQIEKEIGQVVEGKRNAELILKLAERNQVKMPVCAATFAMIQGKCDAVDAIHRMISAI